MRSAVRRNVFDTDRRGPGCKVILKKYQHWKRLINSCSKFTLRACMKWDIWISVECGLYSKTVINTPLWRYYLSGPKIAKKYLEFQWRTGLWLHRFAGRWEMSVLPLHVSSTSRHVQNCFTWAAIKTAELARDSEYFSNCKYKKASIRWQDSARRQFQAGLIGDVGL